MLVTHVAGGYIRVVEEAAPRRCHFMTADGQCKVDATIVSHDGAFCRPHYEGYMGMRIAEAEAREAQNAERAKKAAATRAKKKRLRS
jgi:hypothetical protein